MRSLLLASLLTAGSSFAQGPELIGYWHNWNDVSAPYMELSAVDPRYSVIEVSFAVPAIGTTYQMEFVPAETDLATFLADVEALQSDGRKVLISMGGANATVHLNSDAERDAFVSSMLGIMETYWFDGMDIDLEGASVSITGGTIAAPIDQPTIRLIDAVHSIADQFELEHGVPMLLTMAPETAYVQGGQSAFGGIWGAYLPIIDALRDRLDILQVQLYNSGSMYGIDGAIYEQGTADFIVSQTEALLQGFQTSGGYFAPLPASKIAIGLPACTSAAGGGYVAPDVLAQAVRYLQGSGPRPGDYQTLSTYPDLRGLMTWSVNWDAVSNCASANEYAQAFEDLFLQSTSLQLPEDPVAPLLWPNPVRAGEPVTIVGHDLSATYLVTDVLGRKVTAWYMKDGHVLEPADLPPGTYFILDGSSGHGTTLVVQ
jgi:chitinase